MPPSPVNLTITRQWRFPTWPLHLRQSFFVVGAAHHPLSDVEPHPWPIDSRDASSTPTPAGTTKNVPRHSTSVPGGGRTTPVCESQQCRCAHLPLLSEEDTEAQKSRPLPRVSWLRRGGIKCEISLSTRPCLLTLTYPLPLLDLENTNWAQSPQRKRTGL